METRRTYWWMPAALVGAGAAGVALTSCVATLMVLRTFEEVAVSGRGIEIPLTIEKAAQLPLTAAWIGLVAVLVAAGMTLRAGVQRRPALVAAVAGLALAGGVMPVLLFRQSADFVMREITPGMNTLPPASFLQTIATNLTTTAVVSAACFVVVAVLVMATVRAAWRTDHHHRPTVARYSS